MLVTLLGIVVVLQPAIRVFVADSIIALQLSLESYLGLPSSTIINVRPLQPRKADSPMLVTLLPMITDVRPLHQQKASYPMLVTLLGIVTDVSPLQS